MITWLNSGLDSSSSARPGVSGCRPIADQTYQADMAPRSSWPGMPPGVADQSVVSTCRMVSWALNGRPVKLYSHGTQIDGSLSSSDFRPPAPVSAQVPSLLWKNVSRRLVAAVFPPIRSNNPLMLCGTIHVYWAALPSANPLLLAG